MLNRRLYLPGLIAVLLALMAQLGMGASVPRLDPATGLNATCHTEDGTDKAPQKAPAHPDDCPVCPLCVALHAPAAPLISATAAPIRRTAATIIKTELPPPATAPPALGRPPSQPRAPPTYS